MQHNNIISTLVLITTSQIIGRVLAVVILLNEYLVFHTHITAFILIASLIVMVLGNGAQMEMISKVLNLRKEKGLLMRLNMVRKMTKKRLEQYTTARRVLDLDVMKVYKENTAQTRFKKPGFIRIILNNMFSKFMTIEALIPLFLNSLTEFDIWSDGGLVVCAIIIYSSSAILRENATEIIRKLKKDIRVFIDKNSIPPYQAITDILNMIHKQDIQLEAVTRLLRQKNVNVLDARMGLEIKEEYIFITEELKKNKIFKKGKQNIFTMAKRDIRNVIHELRVYMNPMNEFRKSSTKELLKKLTEATAVAGIGFLAITAAGNFALEEEILVDSTILSTAVLTAIPTYLAAFFTNVLGRNYGQEKDSLSKVTSLRSTKKQDDSRRIEVNRAKALKPRLEITGKALGDLNRLEESLKRMVEKSLMI